MISRKSDRTAADFMLVLYPERVGHVAQGIEHQVPVLRVAGSIPAMLVQ